MRPYFSCIPYVEATWGLVERPVFTSSTAVKSITDSCRHWGRIGDRGPVEIAGRTQYTYNFGIYGTWARDQGEGMASFFLVEGTVSEGALVFILVTVVGFSSSSLGLSTARSISMKTTSTSADDPRSLQKV